MGDVVALQQESPPIKRDRYGRYVLPDPKTGQERSWTRATTLANTLADRFNLEQWAKRNVVLGLAARQDLYALAASCKPDDKDQLARIVSDAEEAAKAHAGANLGTALHRITERIDRREDFHIPDQWRPDVDAYCQTLVNFRVNVVPEWIERVVVIPQIGVAGTLDRLVTIDRASTHTVADLKTGKEAPKYVNETAIQLALYAGASYVWNGDGYDPMPPVDRETAILIHLPVGEGRCTLHEVDIAAGREAVRLALNVRDWRKRRDLARPHLPTKEMITGTDDDW